MSPAFDTTQHPADPAAEGAKRALRDGVLARRDALAGEERAAKSRALLARLIALPQITAARVVLGFVTFRSEVDTLPILVWCLSHGIAVTVPRITGPHHMEACPVTDLASDLVDGHFGIAEPREGLAPIGPSLIDVVLVPGAAFDRHGGRMGYGGGYYDTYLDRLRDDALRVGVAFDLQLVDDVPRQRHDRCVDLVVTEARAVETGCRGDAGPGRTR